MADEVLDVEVQLADNEIVPAKLFLWDESDLVSIFDTSPDVTPATVDEQRKFYEAWLTSFR